MFPKDLSPASIPSWLSWEVIDPLRDGPYWDQFTEASPHRT